MGQNNSRSFVFGPPVIPNSSFPKSIGSYSAIDANTMGAITVEQPVLFPQSEGGNAVTNFVYSPLSSPFQIVSWGDPFSDEYITSTTNSFFDIDSLLSDGIGKEITYTYLYSVTGWTAFNGTNAVSQFENPILDCCNNGCTNNSYPNSRIIQACPGELKIITKKSSDCCCESIVNLRNINTYIFIQSQSRKYTWDFTEFQAYLNAYIIVFNQIEVFLGINPFACIQESSSAKTLYESVCYIQFTYPFMIYVQLILLDAFPAINKEWWALVNMAIDFVSRYARLLWTIEGKFDYEYMQREYLSMYNRRWIHHKTLTYL